MSKPTTDTVDIATLIAAAEGRATCKLGMAKARRKFLIVLAPEDVAALGIREDMRLDVEGIRGTYSLEYVVPGFGFRSVSHEPAEPELQALGVAYARRNPVGAATELLLLDLERRGEEERSRVATLLTRLRAREAELKARKAA